MSIDWNVVTSALHDSRDGHSLKALAILSGLMSEAESDIDRAAILLGESSCHAQLGNIAKSRELLESARTYSQGNRVALSQVSLAEASIDAQCKDYKLACEKFASVKSEYHDLLVQTEHDDFSVELDSRYACALVDAGEFSAAVPLFRKLFERDELEDRHDYKSISVSPYGDWDTGEKRSPFFSRRPKAKTPHCRKRHWSIWLKSMGLPRDNDCRNISWLLKNSLFA